MAPLIAWGARRMGERDSSDFFSPRWAAVAMVGLADWTAATGVSETHQYVVDDVGFYLAVDDGSVELHDGHAEDAAVVVTTEGQHRVAPRTAVELGIAPDKSSGANGRMPEAHLPDDLGWAAASPHIAGFVATVEAAGEAALDESERACVTAAIEAWDGGEPALGSGWIDEALVGLAPGSSQARARVALLAALAPHRAEKATVEAFRRDRPHDRDLLGVVAWAASRAARRIGSWLGTTEPSLRSR